MHDKISQSGANIDVHFAVMRHKKMDEQKQMNTGRELSFSYGLDHVTNEQAAVKVHKQDNDVSKKNNGIQTLTCS